MRPCSAALAAYLAASDSFIVTDVYTVALATGEVLRYPGWTTALQIPGTLFPAGSLNHNALDYTSFALGPRFGRSKIATRIGVMPAELDIDIFAGTDDRVGSLSFADAIRLGLFDGATVELDRLFAPPEPSAEGGLDTSLGALVWFTGRVAECDAGRSAIRLKVKSLMNLPRCSRCRAASTRRLARMSLAMRCAGSTAIRWPRPHRRSPARRNRRSTPRSRRAPRPSSTRAR
jgi:hypothetical protein